MFETIHCPEWLLRAMSGWVLQGDLPAPRMLGGAVHPIQYPVNVAPAP